MNKDEFVGGARYLGGKLEKSAGDLAGERNWQADGVIDQVAGGAQHAYGRARSIAESAIAAGPALADEAGEALRKATHQASSHAASLEQSMRRQPWMWAGTAAAVVGGIALVLQSRR